MFRAHTFPAYDGCLPFETARYPLNAGVSMLFPMLLSGYREKCWF